MDMMAQTRCMIVEDQALLGMSLEAFLEDAGFAVAGVFMSNDQALQWLESDVPDVAILDIMIKDGTSLEIARALKSRGIPFMVYSGLPQKADGPPELRNVPWLEKPVSRETLLGVLDELIEVGHDRDGTHTAMLPPRE
ncbi:response regulator with CheY-like receiver, AAA-type ATPase, and DNA-binding domains [Microvirga lotononidis]|uniref:Response regulator with CheY-like receiver, AAA-type ATPase, and DNA-binding domains n=2 Tax=Microvirga lotononidis TaxID=864069 RepID=I4YZ88_9HYPH|nr:response regulator with CheY-like receiver, AAA-type ATPase, and DNA-binding domains [Microvirga lotononidis]